MWGKKPKKTKKTKGEYSYKDSPFFLPNILFFEESFSFFKNFNIFINNSSDE